MSELTYSKSGHYLIPDISILETPTLGKYGMMRKSFLREHRPTTYTNLLLKETLFPHCLEIEQAANDRLELTMTELVKKDPPPDKAGDPMGWVGHMNNLKAQAEEVIFQELIYS
ncbi:MAG: TnpV protein [Firmicutes bacterium]|nr:TnpV protein [Bacillota bacterium]